MSQWDDSENQTPIDDGATPDGTTTAAPARRFNTTPAWGDPLHAPQPSDPYYAEWRAANPGIPESAAEPVGTQIDVYGNPYGKKPGGDNPGTTPVTPAVPGTGPVTAPGGPLIAPFTEPAPGVPTIPKFTAPTIEEAMADPGYKFVVDQGNTNLTNWAAARGTLNDSSTAKAFIDYGQAAATTQYGNVWDRAARAYDTNTQTQYTQPYQNHYTNWLQDWNIFKDQRDSTFDKQYKVATA